MNKVKLIILAMSIFLLAPVYLKAHKSAKTNLNGYRNQEKIVGVDTKIINDGYGDYILIPEGEFKMGNIFFGEALYEKHIHAVYLDTYYIGKYEVTNKQYAQFINDKGNQTEGGVEWINIASPQCLMEYISGKYKPKSGAADHPVIEVSWYGASAYCRWVSGKAGKTYRLPTEAEWEKAARGTKQDMYPWGNDIDSSYANYQNSADPFETGNYPFTTTVGFYNGSTYNKFLTHDNSSFYGVYDMAGNVWEWCSDWFGSSYYSDSAYKNPKGPSSGSKRIIRGGGWDVNPRFLQSASRMSSNPYNRISSIGFRCVREH